MDQPEKAVGSDATSAIEAITRWVPALAKAVDAVRPITALHGAAAALLAALPEYESLLARVNTLRAEEAGVTKRIADLEREETSRREAMAVALRERQEAHEIDLAAKNAELTAIQEAITTAASHPAHVELARVKRELAQIQQHVTSTKRSS